jgi:peptide/nickel transport system substrate-binding protein/oligopeptide transport system substrate-binding protein
MNRICIPLLAVALVLTACGKNGGSGAAGGAMQTTENLVVNIGISEPKNLIPTSCVEEMGHTVLHALFTGLVRWNEKLEPVEVAAESVSSPDNKVWTIKLKAGWTFHNGEPVTADSYINAWNAGAWGPNAHDGNYFFERIVGYDAMNPLQAGAKPTARKLTGLVKKDELTFEVTLKEPYVNFKTMLGYTPFFPLPQAAFTNVAENELDPGSGTLRRLCRRAEAPDRGHRVPHLPDTDHAVPGPAGRTAGHRAAAADREPRGRKGRPG